MHAHQRRKLFKQFSDLCDGRLSDEQSRQLADLLTNSDETRIAYVQFLDIHASLDRDSATRVTALESLPGLDRASLEQLTADSSTERAVQCQVSRAESKPRYRRLQEFAAAAAVVLLLGAIAWKALPQAGSDVPRPDIVASIVSDLDCTWDGLSASSGDRTLRAGQQLTLTSGVAKLRFGDETVVLIESPTSFEPLSDSSMRVHSGTVALRAEGEKNAFTVLAPNASIVDLGTSFGVHCGPKGVDVEVFEGKVEILPSFNAGRSQVLGLGASARIHNDNGQADIDMFAADEGRFTDLLQLLWEDFHDRSPAVAGDLDPESEPVFPHQEFELPGGVQQTDSFHNSRIGGGWITPWVATGHPIGETTVEDPLTAAGNAYLRLHFSYSYSRAIAREYGATASLDPNRPHVISWIWRFDGQDEDFGGSFHDRIAFYGNEYFRSNSSSDISWFIGWAGDHEMVGQRRKTIPKRWFVFDGKNGSNYGPENLVDTGMELKPGVVYRMAVVLYPKSKQYDAIIQDDEQTFIRARLGYRNPNTHGAHVIHFSVGDDSTEGDASFSIDSIRVEPLRPDLVPKDLRFNVPVDPATEGFST